MGDRSRPGEIDAAILDFFQEMEKKIEEEKKHNLTPRPDEFRIAWSRRDLARELNRRRKKHGLPALHQRSIYKAVDSLHRRGLLADRKPPKPRRGERRDRGRPVSCLYLLGHEGSVRSCFVRLLMLLQDAQEVGSQRRDLQALEDEELLRKTWDPDIGPYPMDVGEVRLHEAAVDLMEEILRVLDVSPERIAEPWARGLSARVTWAPGTTLPDTAPPPP